VVTEKRRDKKVTRVLNLEAYLLPPCQVASDLQHRFASSAGVVDVPGKKKALEVSH
jgi:translation initiation factor 1 (eIF-1/SUI1)